MCCPVETLLLLIVTLITLFRNQLESAVSVNDIFQTLAKATMFSHISLYGFTISLRRVIDVKLWKAQLSRAAT